VLEGSLRKAGNRIRIATQLVEAETGMHLWAERYDRDLADIFRVQDEITEAVTIAVAPAVAEAELQRAMRRPPGNLDAWAAYQRGLWHYARASAEDNGLAQQFFQQAIDLDPSFAGGCIGLVGALSMAALAFGTVGLAEAQSKEETLAQRGVALDPANAEAYGCLGHALWARGDLEGARAEVERALVLCPNLSSAHEEKGWILILSGNPEDGLTPLETALRLDPRGKRRGFIEHYIAIGHYFCREYEAAVEAASRAIRSMPDYPNPRRFLAMALGQLGRTGEAKEALDEAIAIAPAGFDFYVRNHLPW
jgi:adenylate cyclase